MNPVAPVISNRRIVDEILHYVKDDKDVVQGTPTLHWIQSRLPQGEDALRHTGSQIVSNPHCRVSALRFVTQSWLTPEPDLLASFGMTLVKIVRSDAIRR